MTTVVKRQHLIPVVTIAVAILAANLPTLVHLVTTNPLVINAYLAPARPGLLPGLPYIDPNAGFTAQALGHLSALDWLHGHVPWWNPFEGIGSPLAGELQGGSFFPPVLLLALHQGPLLLQITLELTAGWSLYALGRSLNVSRALACAGGIAFGLCGTFAWFMHAPMRPVALLPLSLLGVEHALTAAGEHRRGGWRLLAVAIALSILAGFPETTLIDGLLTAWWAILRAAGPGRGVVGRLGAKVVGGMVTGVAISAPLLVAFVTYLPYASLGAHGSSRIAYGSLPVAGAVQLLLPYSLGPIFGFHATPGHFDTLSAVWGSVGGYLSTTIGAGALVGLFGSRDRLLRLGLGAWILLCLLRTYGFPPVVHLMAAVPGISSTAFYRYADPSWELAAVMLAVLGLDDVARSLTPRRILVAAVATIGALAVWSAAVAWPILSRSTASSVASDPGRHLYPIANLAVALVLLGIMLVGGFRATGPSSPPGQRQAERRRRGGRRLMAAAIAIESTVLLASTSLSAPPPTALQTGSVAWLQAHLGPYRFYTLGPIQPNYGSYFGLGQLNLTDLPRSKALGRYITTRLDPNSPPGIFTGGARLDPFGPTAAAELTAHLANFEAVGVRYVVDSGTGTDVQGSPFPAAGTPAWPAGPRLVYHDSLADIWELPHASPAFSVQASKAAISHNSGGCTVSSNGWNRATVTCAGPALLTRRVLYVAGWSAAVNGQTIPVERASTGPAGLFQQVRVAAGTSTVRFTFVPPFETPAVGIAMVALVAIAGSWWLERRRRSAQPAIGSSDSGPSPSEASPGVSPPTRPSHTASSSGERSGHHGSRRPKLGL